MLEEDQFLFGNLVVRNNLATQEQVDECMEIQRRMEEQGSLVKLGDILVSKGYLTKSQLQLILRAQQKISRGAGQRIPGYEIIAKLGQGSMGSVYKAKQISMDRVVAIKVLSQQYSRNKEYVDRFIREARAAAQLSHANIVRAIDVGNVRDLYYFVMEYVDGRSVEQRLRKEKTISEKEALHIALQVCRALKHAHSHGVIHRDIKPDNILVSKDGIAKLCDLGLAKAGPKSSDDTDHGEIIGTPNYMSPEQARGSTEVDERTDIYSLGATLYHMVTGHLPFGGTSAADAMVRLLTEPLVHPRQRNPALSLATSVLIRQMMAKDPSERHSDISQVEEDILCILDGRPPRHIRDSAVPETRTQVPGALEPATASRTTTTTDRPSRRAGARRRRRPVRQGPGEKSPGAPALVFLSGEHQGRTFRIRAPLTLVGRRPECDIRVSDTCFSRRHFIIHVKGDEFEIEDLESMNGTRLNGQRITRAPLAFGDKIGVHNTLMQFVSIPETSDE